jgi:hypothetical protein
MTHRANPQANIVVVTYSQRWCEQTMVLSAVQLNGADQYFSRLLIQNVACCRTLGRRTGQSDCTVGQDRRDFHHRLSNVGPTSDYRTLNRSNV